MIGFFAKRPALALLTVIAMLAAGGVMAHRREAPRRGKTAVPLSLARKQSLRHGQADWRPELDVDKARLAGGKLVQRLSDGTRVTYSIDPRLQQWATEYLRSYELPYAGMVALDVRTGKVLVMAAHSQSRPGTGTREICLTPWAPAASVYKLVTASALLSRGVSPEATVCYHGGFHGLTREHITDNAKLDQSCRSLSFAIAKSVNPIMGKLALRHLSPRDQEDWAYRFGFNRPIPFELPVQPSKAVIPTGDLERARVAAGFWKTQASVLHGAMIAGVAATGGRLLWPTIVESARDQSGRELDLPVPEPERVMSKGLAEKLATMMVSTTTMGTARKGFHGRKGEALLPGIDVGGKTGSLSRENPFLHYSWFVGFAPAKAPRVAFAVLLGNPAKWRIKAHTAARVMLSQYFKLDASVGRPRASGIAAATQRPAKKASLTGSSRTRAAAVRSRI